MVEMNKQDRRTRVARAVKAVLDECEYNERSKQFRAAHVKRKDPDLSAAVIGTYLPILKNESPLSNGLTIETYTERNCGANLWTVKLDQDK